MGRLEAWTRLGLVTWAMAITMARAVRWPNDFAEAHWLLDYRFGLIRRGFAGSLLSLAARAGLPGPSERLITVLAVLAFALLLLVLLRAAARCVSSDADPGVTFAAAAVVATSPFIVMAAHFMGYLDHLLVAASFAAAWLARDGRPWAAAAIAAIGVLLHESFVVAGLPLVLFGAALRPAGFRRFRAAGLVPFALPVAAALALWASETFLLDRAELRGQLVARLSAFSFVGGDMNLFVPEWLTTGALATWASQRHAFWRHLSDPNLLRLMVPSAAFLVVVTAALAPGGWRVRRTAAAAAVALAPLLLHAVAWDTARIWTYTIVAGFGCVWLSSAADGIVRAGARRWLLAAAVPIVVANIAGRSPLMDGEVERFSLAARAMLYLPFLAGGALAFVDGWRTRGASARAGGPVE
jgi:hypothetical protein